MTGIYVLNTTETAIIHTFLLVTTALIARYVISFAGEMFHFLV
jgi:hypothetical protein